MCLIIAKPNTAAAPPREHLVNAALANPHGIGFAIADGHRLTIRKGFQTVDNALAAYARDTKSGKPHAALWHFRFATHGDKTRRNCHPFGLWPGWAMAHNGMLTGFDHPQWSDTRLLARLLRSISDPYLVLDKTEGRKALADHIGQGNKLVFIHQSGRLEIVNEQSGNWEDGRWYSNNAHQPRQWNYTCNVFDDDWHQTGFFRYRKTFPPTQAPAPAQAQADPLPGLLEEREELQRAYDIAAARGDDIAADQAAALIASADEEIKELRDGKLWVNL